MQNELFIFLFFLTILGLISSQFLKAVIYQLPMKMKLDLQNHDLHTWQDTHTIPPYLIESISIFTCIYLGWHFDLSWQLVPAVFLSFALICLSAIDIQHQLIPDEITLPLLWIGLMINLYGVFTNIENAVLGCITGYISLWSIAKLFTLFLHKEGIGHGDFKLFAALGAWFGWQILPLLIAIASIIAIIISLPLFTLRKQCYNTPIPFAPFLASAGWIVMLWENQLTDYVNILGIS